MSIFTWLFGSPGAAPDPCQEFRDRNDDLQIENIKLAGQIEDLNNKVTGLNNHISLLNTQLADAVVARTEAETALSQRMFDHDQAIQAKNLEITRLTEAAVVQPIDPVKVPRAKKPKPVALVPAKKPGRPRVAR